MLEKWVVVFTSSYNDDVISRKIRDLIIEVDASEASFHKEQSKEGKTQ